MYFFWAHAVRCYPDKGNGFILTFFLLVLVQYRQYAFEFRITILLIGNQLNTEMIQC